MSIISYYHILYSLDVLYLLFNNVHTILFFSGVISVDELHTGHHNNPMEPDGTRTPPTPSARSPPPTSPPPSRIPAVAHLRGSVNCVHMKREEINFFLVFYYT